MRIALISGSRSDRNALVMVKEALENAILNDWRPEPLVGDADGFHASRNHAYGHEIRWINLGQKAMVGPSTWAMPKEPWQPITATEKALFWTSLNVNGFGADQLGRADLAIVHGDRHEILAAAVACNVMGITIAHIGGGDITEGSQDDCFRHAITKLSHLHFASNQDSADRIVQMGEEPDRVHVTGCPGIDMVVATPIHDRDLTFTSVGLATPQKCLLVLFHPNTLGDTGAELEALSVALARRTEACVLLGPNADAGSDLIRREWQRLAQNRPETVYHDTVAPQVFYSLLRWCDVLVGNSSAAYYEAPCFGTKTLDIGYRQLGRTRAGDMSEIYPPITADVLGAMIETRIKDKKRDDYPKNVYGYGHAAERIVKVIGGIKDPRALLRKRFQSYVLDSKIEPLPMSEPSGEFQKTMQSMHAAIRKVRLI